MMTVIVFVIMLILFIVGFPLFLALLISSIIGILLLGIPLPMITASFFDSMYRESLLAVPFFILAGNIMLYNKMTIRLVHFFDLLLSRFHARTGIVGILSCAYFGAISGSSPAAVATIGRLMHPQAVEEGYGEAFSGALISSSASLAIIIPPSITMIIYASVTNTSVGSLFMAGLIPGMTLALLLSLYVSFVMRKKYGFTTMNKVNLGDIWVSLKVTIPVLFMPIVVLGGIYGGIFSPTEASVISVLYSIIYTVLDKKQLPLKDLWECFVSSAKLTSQVLIILASATVLAQFFTLSHVSMFLVKLVSEYQISKITFLIIINFMFLILGMFIDPGSAIVALMPILIPVVKMQGIDLVHFGLIAVLNFSIGMFTPPFGLNLFTILSMFKFNYRDLIRQLVPFVIIFLVVLILFTYLPSKFVLWLPRLMY